LFAAPVAVSVQGSFQTALSTDDAETTNVLAISARSAAVIQFYVHPFGHRSMVNMKAFTAATGDGTSRKYVTGMKAEQTVLIHYSQFRNIDTAATPTKLNCRWFQTTTRVSAVQARQ
jgi:hypothetical protein